MAYLNSSYSTGANTTQLPNNGGTYQAPTVTPRSKYIDPKTGTFFKTPQEWGNYIATKIPISSDVPKYAGDAMTNPDQSVTDLQGTARNLNNARNDIATGATDPYGVGNKSGIAYSPTELKAIEKAYAGIYDPALNDVFARLKTKQDEEDRLAKREEQIFATNESIRQWKATTGSKGSGSSDIFSDYQLAGGASNAGLTLSDFQRLDDNIKNLYINPPMVMGDDDKPVAFYKKIMEDIKAGVPTEDIIDSINNTNVSQIVKDYLLKQVPANAAVKSESGWSHYWNELGGDIVKGDLWSAAGSLFGQ